MCQMPLHIFKWFLSLSVHLNTMLLFPLSKPFGFVRQTRKECKNKKVRKGNVHLTWVYLALWGLEDCISSLWSYCVFHNLRCFLVGWLVGSSIILHTYTLAFLKLLNFVFNLSCLKPVTYLLESVLHVQHCFSH